MTAMARSFSKLTLGGKILFTLGPILFLLTAGLVVLVAVAGRPIVDFLATNIWLALRGMPVIDWPERLIGTDSPARNDYIAALEAADQGNFEPLIAMHRDYLSTS